MNQTQPMNHAIQVNQDLCIFSELQPHRPPKPQLTLGTTYFLTINYGALKQMIIVPMWATPNNPLRNH